MIIRSGRIFVDEFTGVPFRGQMGMVLREIFRTSFT
jgi:hypothetical protein